MAKHGIEHKGGKGGRNTRMRERLGNIETPTRDLLQKYLVHYGGRELYLGDGVMIPTSENLFRNSHPLQVDLGCGRGEHVIGEAERHPETNFVGIDFHDKSLYIGIQVAAELGLTNVVFVLANLSALLRYFPDETVERASVLFPAPVINPKDEKLDVLNRTNITQVHRMLGENDSLLLVTDAEWYFQEKVRLMQELGLFTLLFSQQAIEEVLITRYQKQWQSKGIPSNRAELKKLSTC